MKRVFFLIGFFVLLLLFNRWALFKPLRSFLETALALPFYSTRVSPKAPNALEAQNLREKVKDLSQENKILRDQLGAIPERSNLFPATVVSETPSELYLSFNYPQKQTRTGQPVVLGKIYLGQIIRRGGRLLVVEKPVSSGFVAKGRTESGVEGKVLGRFNEQVVFETKVNNSVKEGESIYLIDDEQGWRFLVGEVSEVSRDKRLPLKQAVIDYLPDREILTTVFVVD